MYVFPSDYKDDYTRLMFNATNFRGYGADQELVAKAYVNDWAAGISSKAWQSENEPHLRTKADLMHTDPYNVNFKKVLEEGKKWLRDKYGFNS